nr:MAG TPA: hypothetical protein [Caudoviricetes sp.]
MKASFDAEQPNVRSVRNGHTLYIFICVNGQWTERQYDESQSAQQVWECDYREIVTNESKIDLEKVMAAPEKYLDWAEPVEKTDSEKITELQKKNEMLTQCLMEMSEIVYA